VGGVIFRIFLLLNYTPITKPLSCLETLLVKLLIFSYEAMLTNQNQCPYILLNIYHVQPVKVNEIYIFCYISIFCMMSHF